MKMSAALRKFLWLDWQALAWALLLAARNTGTAIPTRIPMIKMTIINSMRVKPSCL